MDPKLYFDRSLFPFLTTEGHIQKLTVYEMPRVDGKFLACISAQRKHRFWVFFTSFTSKCTEASCYMQYALLQPLSFSKFWVLLLNILFHLPYMHLPFHYLCSFNFITFIEQTARARRSRLIYFYAGFDKFSSFMFAGFFFHLSLCINNFFFLPQYCTLLG